MSVTISFPHRFMRHLKITNIGIWLSIHLQAQYFSCSNLELTCASGMCFINTDCKCDVVRNYGTIAKKYYGYNVSVLDMRNPKRSDENNILHLSQKSKCCCCVQILRFFQSIRYFAIYFSFFLTSS